jgi:copper chaperone CopZ
VAKVAELSVDIDADDRATAKIAAVDALIKGLGGDVETVIDVNIKNAERDLAAIIKQIKEVDGKKIKVDVDVDQIGKTLDDIAKKTMKIDVDFDQSGILEMRRLIGQDVTVDADTRAALASLAALRAQLAALSDESIDIDLDTGALLAEIAAMETAIRAVTRDREIEVDVNVEGLFDLDRLASSATRTSGQIRGVTAAVAALGPALVPLGGAALLAVGALGAGFLAAAAGVVAFGGVTYSVYKPVVDALDKMKTQQDAFNRAVTDKQRDAALEKQKAIWESLTPAQKQAADGLSTLTSAWNDLVDAMTTDVLQVTGRGMAMVGAAIPALLPMLRNMAFQFDSLLTSLEKNVNSPFWQEFLTNMSFMAGPMTASLVRSFGNIITGIAGILSAFIPMSGTMMQGLEQLTARFAEWGKNLGDSPGFKAFTKYVRDNWPLVESTIRAVSRAVVELIQAMLPIGGFVLKGIRELAEAITKLGEEHPKLLKFAVAVAGLGLAFLNLIGPAASIIATLARVGGAFSAVGVFLRALLIPLGLSLGPFLLVAGAVAALGAAMVIAYKQSANFRELVDYIGDKAGKAFGRFKADVQEALDGLKSFIDEQSADWKKWWQENEKAVREAGTNIKADIKSLVDGIGAAFGPMWAQFTTITRLSWAVITGIFDGAMQVIRGSLRAWAAVVNGDWSELWNGLVDIAKGLGNMILEPIKRLWKAIDDEFARNGVNLKQKWDDFWNGLAADGSWDWTPMVSEIWASITSAFDGLDTSSLSTWWSNLWDGLAGDGSWDWTPTVGEVWDGLTSAFEGLDTSAIGTWFSGLWEGLGGEDVDWSGAISSVWNKLVDTLTLDAGERAAIKEWFSGLWEGLGAEDIDWSGAVAAVGAALITALLGSVAGLAAQVGTWFVGLFANLGGEASKVNWSGIGSTIGTALMGALTGSTAGLASQVGAWFVSLFSDLGSKASQINWNAVGTAVGTGLMGALNGSTLGLSQQVGTWFTTLFGDIDLGKTISEWWDKAWTGIKGFGSMIKEKLFGGGDGGAGDAKAQVTTEMDNLIRTMQEKFDRLNEVWIDGWTRLSALNTTTWVGINAAVGQQMDAMAAEVSAGFADMNSAWIDGWATLSALNTTAWVGIQGAVTQQMTTMGATITTGFATITVSWSAGWTALAASTTAAWIPIQTMVAQQFLTLQATFAAGFLVLGSAWTLGWATLATATATGWAPIQTAIAQQFLTMQTTFAAGFLVLGSAWTLGWATLAAATVPAWAPIQTTVAQQFLTLQTTFAAGFVVLTSSWTLGWTTLAAATAPGWVPIQAAVTAQFVLLQTTFTTGFAVLTTTWTAGWATLATATATGWVPIQAAVAQQFLTLQATFTAGFTVLNTAWVAGWTLLVTSLTTIWAQIQLLTAQQFLLLTTAFTAGFAALNATFVAGFAVLLATWTAGWLSITDSTTLGWAQIQAASQVGVTALLTLVTATSLQLITLWTTLWTQMITVTTNGWIQIMTVTQVGLATLLAAFTAATAQMTSVWISMWNQLVSTTASSSAQVVSIIAAMGNQIIATLQSVASRAQAAGASIGANLAAGIRSQVGAVAAAAQALAAAASAPLPGSPAKTGPLSGRGYALLRGERMVQDLARGLGVTGPVSTAMGDIADLMALSMAPRSAMAAITSGRNVLGQGGGNIVVEAGAVTVNLPPGADLAAARAAFSDAGEELASLLSTLRRQ